MRLGHAPGTGELDFDQFEVGEHVQYLVNGYWHDGTVVVIDYNDDSMPWGVSIEVTDRPEHTYNGDAWEWRDVPSVRKSSYVIEEEP